MITAWAPPLPREQETDPLGLLTARFRDVPIWFGKATRHWWALDGDRLIEAVTPEELERVLALRHPWEPPTRAYIPMSQAAPMPHRSVERTIAKERHGIRKLLRRPMGSWSPA
jgi:hypothetical protein